MENNINHNSNYKYVIVFFSFILMAVPFSIVNSISAMLVAPVTAARGFSLSSYSLLFTINSITIAICSPIIGTLLNKINIKIIMTVSAVLTGVGYIMYGFARNILTFYIIGAVVSIGMSGLTSIPINTMISDWFEPKKKGSVVGIVFAGIGTGSFFWNQIVSRLLEDFNYNIVYLLLGVVILIVAIPISLFVAKRPAHAYDNKTSHKTGEQSHKMSFKEISTTPNFWSFAIGLLLMGMSFAGTKQHIQSYLSSLGYPISFNANIGSLLAVMGIIINIVGGIIFDKFKTKNVLAVICSFGLLALLLLFAADKPTFVYLFTVVYGLSMCISSVWPAFGVSKIFSNENYSVIYGFANMFMTIGSSVGPFLSGLIADTSFGYEGAWALYFIVNIIYSILFIKSVKN